MKLNLIFQFYSKVNLSAADYFSDILSEIDPEYPYTASETRTLFVPVDYDDVQNIAKKGVYTIEKPIKDISHPHYVIKEMVVSFEIGDSEDHRDVREHVLGMFGKQATIYQLIEEGVLNDPV